MVIAITREQKEVKVRSDKIVTGVRKRLSSCSPLFLSVLLHSLVFSLVACKNIKNIATLPKNSKKKLLSCTDQALKEVLKALAFLHK